MPTCTECGSQFDDEYEFCTECGAKQKEIKQKPRPPKQRAAAPAPPPPAPLPPPSPAAESRPPAQPAASQTRPPEKESSSKWKIIAILAIVVIVLIVSCAIFGLLIPDEDEDKDPPEVYSTYPYDGETGVDVDTYFIIEFNEKMYQSEYIYESLFVFPSDIYSEEYYYGEFSLWLDSKTVSIGFLFDSLDYNTEYIATLTYPRDYEVKDKEGNYAEAVEDIIYLWTFTTEAYTSSDTTAPYVYSTDPDYGDYDIEPASSIEITFSEPMYKSTNIHEGLHIDGICRGSGSSWIDSDTVTITLDSTLDYGTTYDMDLRYAYLCDIKDLNDNNAEYCDDVNCIVYEWTFITITETITDTTPPYVISTSPYEGETDVDDYVGSFTITFNEPMYQSATIHEGMYLEWFDNSTEEEMYAEVGSSSYWSDSKTVVINIEYYLEVDTTYTASLRYPYTHDIEDINGNTAEYYDSEKMSIHEWTFTTESY